MGLCGTMTAEQQTARRSFLRSYIWLTLRNKLNNEEMRNRLKLPTDKIVSFGKTYVQNARKQKVSLNDTQV
jgi:hypothetical protein